MQAIILAAGMGKRLGKYTKNATKCMVPVNNKTLIEYAVETLVSNNIKKLTIVVGYKSEVLKKFLSDKFNIDNLNGMTIEYIENPVYASTNNIYSLYLAKEVMAQDDTILLESDLIFKPEIISSLIQNPEKNIAVVSPFEPWMDGTCALLDSENNITDILDKNHFNWNETHRYYKTVNIYKFSREFSKQYYIPFLDAYQKAFGRNEYYEQVLKVLSFLSSTTLKALSVSGEDWYEIDDPADLSIAENKFATGTEKLHLLQKRYGGYWRFPKLKDFCYLVNPYFPPEQMIKELTSNFQTLLTQYPSGASEQSLLAAKIFNIPPEYIAAGNGAAELIASLGEKISGKIAIPYPTFNEYPERFIHAETVPVPVHPETFQYTVCDILNTVKKTNVQSVLLINPDNPSGNFIGKQDILSLCTELYQRNVRLFFDESFIDFAEPGIRYTLLNEEILKQYPNLVVIKSISKSYGVPGLRLGIIASSKTEYIADIKKVNAIWNINSFAEYYFQIYEKYQKNYAAACDSIATERNRFIQELRKIPFISVIPSQANFLLCKLDTEISPEKLAVHLLEQHNIFIKDLSGKKGFETGNFIRLAVRNEEDNNLLLSALHKYQQK